MAISDIEDNDSLPNPGDVRQRAFKNDMFLNRRKNRAFNGGSDQEWGNFLGISLRGKAYNSEEDEVTKYESDVKAGKFDTAFPVKASPDCSDLSTVQSQMDTEINNLNRKAQSAKPAFRARWEALTDQLRQHKDKVTQANAALNCEQQKAAQDQADTSAYLAQLQGVITTAVNSSQSKTSLTPYIVLGAIGILGVGVLTYILVRKKSVTVPLKPTE